MIFIIGASLAFFLEFILISKKEKSLADKILTIWMFVLGTHLLLHFIEDQQLDQKYHFLLGLATPFPLLSGPFLYLYTKVLTSGKARMDRLDYLHFLPAVLLILRMLPFFFLPGLEKLQYTQELEEQRSVLMIIVLYSYMVSGVIYITLSLLVLRRHRKNLAANFSYTDRINLNWLRNLIIGMIAIWSIVTIGHTWDHLMDINIGAEVDQLIFMSLSLFILMIGYFGIKQTWIFSGQIALEAHEQQRNVKKKDTDFVQYRKSGLKREQADKLQAQLEKIMKEEKPFLDHKLTLKVLAENLNIHPNYLSQVINERFQKKFYDFINTARIEEFKTLVQQPKSQNLTLLALAMDCGFSSKSSFNKFFKKSTGKTPSEFIRSKEN